MAEPGMTNPHDASPSPTRSVSEPALPLHDRELPLAGPEAGEDIPRAADASGAAAVGPEDALSEDQVKIALRRVKDPELNLNILDLGLVYEIRVDGNDVAIDMSLTSPGCPSGPEIMSDAERHLKAIPGVGNVAVNLVWSPFWSPDRIEPRVRAYLGF
ncbi:MAG TPA: metal-sulfur cluster assembly factor [Gemmatimonadaceae bacterium]|nr:metal-sulfur cluster assembly factor [Gemmatimonadaceae bacterium]